MDSFRLLSAKHSAMLYPAYSLRGTFRERFGGDKFWSLHEKKRMEKFGERYWPAMTIIACGGDLAEMLNQEKMKGYVDMQKTEMANADKAKQA